MALLHQHEKHCDHCDLLITGRAVERGDHSFCCRGCASVFQMMASANESGAMGNITGPSLEEYAYLEDPDMIDQLLSHDGKELAQIQLKLPAIHCSSCLYLLENLTDLHRGVVSCRVNFLKKEAAINFEKAKISLRQLVELLVAIGYPPELTRGKEKSGSQQAQNSLIVKLGVAAFGFGNVMLLSFPEYFGGIPSEEAVYFRWISLAIALPVVLYSGGGYLRSAWVAIQYGKSSLDIPIALGMMALLLRSGYEIFTFTGSGYLDSLTGFVFFLLLGRWFQNLTYRNMSFDRDYRSYIPISAFRKEDGQWRSVPASKLREGDCIRVRPGEIIPSDGILVAGEGQIDYSFITGEAESLSFSPGDQLLAGGKQSGSTLEMKLSSDVDKSYLIRLWDQDPFQMPAHHRLQSLMDRIGGYFTIAIVFISLGTFGFWGWWMGNMSMAFIASTAVLIIACPCALALAMPFTFGNVVRILSIKGLFLRNIDTVSHLQQLDWVVFDKTGTLTAPHSLQLEYEGEELSGEEKAALLSLADASIHPLSRGIVRALKNEEAIDATLCNVRETPGKGVEGRWENRKIRMGSAEFLGLPREKKGSVWIEIDGQLKGCFHAHSRLRPQTEKMIRDLAGRYRLAVLSGDDEREASMIQSVFPDTAIVKFRQMPVDKQSFIAERQEKGERVLYIGDGLNDANALRQADVGMVLTEDGEHFSPSGDAILQAAQWPVLSHFLEWIRKSRFILYACFAFAFLYNVIGLVFAVQGLLTPVVAAILMPLSSISIILLATLAGKVLFMKFPGAQEDEHPPVEEGRASARGLGLAISDSPAPPE